MSENAEGQPEDSTPVILPPEEHTNKKEASFLARFLGFVVGREQAGAAEPPVKNLAERIKRLGPEATNEAIDAAIAAYGQKRQEEEAGKSPTEPEQG